MTGLALLFFLGFGLQAFLPTKPFRDIANAGIGIRYFCAMMCIPLLLYAGNVLLRMPLHVAAWGVVALAAIGWGVVLMRVRAGAADRSIALQPLFILNILCLAAAASQIPNLTYLVVLSDEFTNWVGWARQMVVLDTTVASEMQYIKTYIPGWAYFLAFPGLLAGRFDADQMIGIPVAVHIGFLAMFVDLVMQNLKGKLEVPNRFAAAFVWLILLCFLLLEISWKLVPTDVLSERPQFYTSAAIILLGWVSIVTPSFRQFGAVLIGVLLAAAFAVKTAGIVLPPVVLGFAVIMGFRDYQSYANARRVVFILLSTLAPFAVVYFSWGALGPEGICKNNPSLGTVVGSIFSAEGGVAQDLFIRFAEAVGGYAVSYKLPVTILAAVGFGAALVRCWRDARWVVLAVLGYALLYTGALYWVYLECFSGYPLEILSSHPRYFRVVIRTFHIVGFFFAATIALEMALPHIRRFAPSRHIALVTGCLVAAGVVWQGMLATTSFKEMGARSEIANQAWIAKIRRINANSAVVRQIADNHPKDEQVRILVLSQGDVGDHRLAAESGLLPTVRGDTFKRYVFESPFNFGEARNDTWTKPMSKESFRNLLFDQDVIWPTIVDDWAKEAMVPFIFDPVCADNIEDYILRVDKERRSFVCFKKI